MVRFGRVGDLLVVTPALRALRRACPHAQIDLLSTMEGRLVAGSNPHVDSVHVLKRRRIGQSTNPGLETLARTLRRIRYDAVFLFEKGRRYHDMIAQIDAGTVYTFGGDSQPSGARQHSGDAHHLDHLLAVLRHAGIEPAGRHYDFVVDDEAERRACGLLERSHVRLGDTFAILHAGHFRKRWDFGRRQHAKSWPIERWIDLADGLAERGVDHVLLTGTSSERRMNGRIRRHVRHRRRVIDLAGRTDLATLAAVIRRAAVVIAPDTGPAHLAAALETHIVGLFGPKSPELMGPLGDESRIERLYPAPSMDSEHQRAGHHARMWAITAAEVMAAIDRLGVQLDGAHDA